MVDQRLRRICAGAEQWCLDHDVQFRWACDESDLQSIVVFNKKVNNLIKHLSDIAISENIYMDVQRVRGGNVISFSLAAIAESKLDDILNSLDVSRVSMDLAEKLELALIIPQPSPIQEKEEQEELNANALAESAKKIAEAQYKTALGGMARCNQDTRQRQAFTRNTTFGGVDSMKPKRLKRKKRFVSQLHEALEGMAIAGTDPKELFRKFAKALGVLGQEMGVGSIQDILKDHGIKWKMSDDGLSIILYVINGTTNAPQPIARISHDSLDSPNEFEQQLKMILDIAKGRAPGTTDQIQQKMRDQESMIRDLAKSAVPQDQNQLGDAAFQAASPKI